MAVGESTAAARRRTVLPDANAYFAAAGITVTRVLTDNGACYRSNDFKHALGTNVTHKRTRPYRPQTNGKVCEYRWWCWTVLA